MALLKPFFRFSPEVIWNFLKRVYLLIQPLSMIVMSWFLPSGPMEADRTTRMKFITELEQACSQSALAPGNPFLPEGKIPSLVTTENVKKLMPRANTDLVEFVRMHAKKVFLTTLLSRHDTVHAAMSSFYEHGIMDNALPMKALASARHICVFPPEGECHHKTQWPCFQSWECCEVSGFNKSQWVFCAPVFMENDSLLELDESHVLPFTSVDEIGTGGHFSTVSRAKIHPDHYRAYGSSNKDASGQVHVALKHMKNLREPGYNVQTAWASEVGAFDQINQLRNKHLIRRTGAFRAGKSYYIMFEWADGGTLRDVWERQNVDHTTLNGTRIMQVLGQLHGLAEALSKLHNTVNNKQQHTVAPGSFPRAETIIASPSLNVPKTQLQVAGENSDNTGEEHWRLGDLKPDNILLFRDATSTWLGTLKIADLGLAKQHAFATSQRGDPTRQKNLTSHYEAPEVIIKRHEPRSRLYGIWPMGCIIFEFVIWLLYGYPGLHNFYGEKPPTTWDTLYFTINPREDYAQVSCIVRRWMDCMLQFDPECNGDSPSALGDLIKLVRDRLLVVSLPQEKMAELALKKCRADSGELEEKLGQILRKAMESETYLFTGFCREGVQVPEIIGRPDDGSSSRVDTDLESIFSDAFSISSKTESSFDGGQRDAIGLLTKLLFNHEDLSPLYSAASTKVTPEKLQRHLRGFFRDYGDGLTKEAHSGFERRAAAFVRGHARYVAREISLLVVPNDLAAAVFRLPTEPTESTKKMIDEWLTSASAGDELLRENATQRLDKGDHKDAPESNEDEDEEYEETPVADASRETYQALEMTKEFLLSANAFRVLQQSLRRWLKQGEPEAKGKDPATTADANEAEHEKELGQASDTESLEGDQITASTQLDGRETTDSAWSIASLWCRLMGMLDPPPNGSRRVTYTCGCGDLQYLDVEELIPGGAAEFQQAIREAARAVRQHTSIPGSSSGASSVPQAHLGPARPSNGQGQTCSPLPSLGSGLPSSPTTNSQTTVGNSSGPIAREPEYLLICINTKRGLAKLEHVDVSSITNDQFLFAEILRAYYGVRRGHEWEVPRYLPKLISFPSLLEPHGSGRLFIPKRVEFVQFQLMPVRTEIYAGSMVKPDIPSEEEVLHKRTYEYRPIPLNVKILQIPAHELLKPGPHLNCFWRDRFPKKLKSMLLWDEQADCLGWGIHITEDWNKPLATLLALLVILAFGVFVIIYGVLAKDWGTGATLGSFLATLFILYCTLQYQWWIEQ